jgi:hypothetical protein
MLVFTYTFEEMLTNISVILIGFANPPAWRFLLLEKDAAKMLCRKDFKKRKKGLMFVLFLSSSEDDCDGCDDDDDDDCGDGDVVFRA